jgi:hypothetical protein
MICSRKLYAVWGDPQAGMALTFSRFQPNAEVIG